MNSPNLPLLVGLVVAFSACTDFQEPAPPSVPNQSRMALPTATVAVVYSNFGLDTAFDTNPSHGWTINGFLSANIGQQAISQQFTPSINYVFRDAKMPVISFSGPPSIRVFLQADSNGLPGSVIDAISVSGFGSIPTIVTATSTLFPILYKGTPYWLTLVAGDTGVLAGWQRNLVGDTSSMTFAGTQGGSPAGPWSVGQVVTRGAFQVDGRPLTPQDGIALLIEDVDTLVSEGIRKGC